MKPALLWTPRAQEDLLEIYVTIGMDSPAAAERMLTALEKQAEQLRIYPRIGVRRPEIAPSARMLVEAPYLILYELSGQRRRLCTPNRDRSSRSRSPRPDPSRTSE